jgi:hypothetical protein
MRAQWRVLVTSKRITEVRTLFPPLVPRGPRHHVGNLGISE